MPWHDYPIRFATKQVPMLISEDWQKQNPINNILEPGETLLWIGRPNEEIYVRGNRTQQGITRVCAWASILFIATVIGIFYSPSLLNTCVLTMLLVVIPVVALQFLSPQDYKRADWYVFSEKRIFLATWDDEDCEFATYQTELSNLRDISVRKAKKVPEEAQGTGNLVCAYERSIQMRISNQFTFELIDNPTDVQALLLDAKAVCVV